ncbi:17-beta-hydroxysteroid dehydrogenase 14 [Plakobranchus ocellatus]|uniref:17-beta-hydroxysteroid dehydrogenase 14 n=1 Tax=Plakobranchus ocellatus TaxID=259542 RepID=A0AAV4C3B2_9GAST|nr:17-beta-hydroxysteroid dehydrogenase 14 [Plakobranchus ocellatus]
MGRSDVWLGLGLLHTPFHPFSSTTQLRSGTVPDTPNMSRSRGVSAKLSKHCCITAEQEGNAVEAKLNNKGVGQCKFVLCDVSNESQVKRVIETAIELYGQLDCLINNAGTHPPHLPIDGYSGEDFHNIIGINVFSIFSACKFALPHLRKTQGNIINNCSLVADIGQLHAVTYCASKGAILSMTKALAIDEACHNVRVNSFAPSNVFTPLWEKAALASSDYNAAIQTGKDSQLLGRFGTMEEVGLVCLFLAADATFCTGININVSGGAELDYGKKSRIEASKAE